MKRLIPAAILLLTVAAAHAAGPKPDMQAQMQEMQAAQAKMMAAMMTESKSRLGFDQTVALMADLVRTGQPAERVIRAIAQRGPTRGAEVGGRLR